MNPIHILLDQQKIADLFTQCNISFASRKNNAAMWEQTLLSCPYIPACYTNMNVDFLLEIQHGNGTEAHDLSIIILWDNKPVAVWPLFVSVIEGKTKLNFLGPDLVAPLCNCTAVVEKKIVKNCLAFINQLMNELNIDTCSSVDLFMNQQGISEWQLQSMALGAHSDLRYDSYVNIEWELASIKKHFRGSYKSLINSAQRLWSAGIMGGENADAKVWSEFKELHAIVAGRKTRSDASWDIHFEDVRTDQSFLVYLRDEQHKMIGAGLFNTTRDEGLYASAAYDRSLFDKPVGHLVQYRAIEEMKKRNLRWYKIGARPYASQTPAPSEKEISIGVFKQGFSTNVFPAYHLRHTIQRSSDKNGES